MGLLDLLLPDQGYHAKRLLVKRWLLKVELPDFENLEELPFEGPNLSDSDSDGDQHHDQSEYEFEPLSVFPNQFTLVMNNFDYSGHAVTYSKWQDPFGQASAPEPQSFQYSTAPIRSAGDGDYRRPLVPVQSSIFQIPGVVEESASEESETEGK